VRILAFGDSLTLGNTLNMTHLHPYTLRLRELLQDHNKTGITFDIDNAGICGEFARLEMTSRLPPILQSKGPYDLVIILGGTNDLGDTHVFGAEKALYDEIITLHLTAHRHGATTMLITIPESDYIYDDMGRNRTSYVTQQGEKGRNIVNQMLRKFAGETDDVILCDLATEHPHTSEEDKSKYWDDGLHYTPKGYDKMGEIIFEKLKTFIF